MGETPTNPGFTEESWKVDDNGDVRETRKGWLIACVPDFGDYEHCQRAFGAPDQDLVQRRMNLIAQAPKLYELLEWAVRTGGRFADPDSAPNPEACEATIKGREARELLREVRGE